MSARRKSLILALAAGVAIGLAVGARAGPIGNLSVPQPAKPVDLGRYAGLWYEIGRYENGFERGMEAVTAEYRPRGDGLLQVINAGRRGGLDGPASRAVGRAKVVPGSGGAKLKVSFFGPFWGDYWVLDHDPDYAWSIVGEPSGRYLWLLSRTARPSPAMRDLIESRARSLGYDVRLIRPTLQ
jgi:apolipoprotein D and lipocalin family protein